MNAFFNKKEDDLSTMSQENRVLVCTVELTGAANSLMGGTLALSLGSAIGIASIGKCIQMLSPWFGDLTSTYLWPLVPLSFFAFLSYWGYGFEVQNQMVDRYRLLLRDKIGAAVGTFVWVGERTRFY